MADPSHSSVTSAILRVAAVIFVLTRAALALAAPPPQRVMSINLCTDQLLLNLLPPERITSVTFLSRERYESFLSAEAWQVGVNHGAAEEVIRDRPDLVLVGSYSTPDTARLINAVGIPVLEMEPANSFQDIRDQTRRLGHLLGVDARAERLLAEMDAKLAQLKATRPDRPITIVGWEGGGAVPGEGTLSDAIFSAAGAVNLGASPGLRLGRFDTEQLVLLHPDLLAYGNALIAAPSLQEAPLDLPPIRRLYAGREIVYPELLYNCGLPQSADAAIQIRQTMLMALRGVANP